MRVFTRALPVNGSAFFYFVISLAEFWMYSAQKQPIDESKPDTPAVNACYRRFTGKLHRVP